MKYIGNIITTNKIDVSEFFNISNSIKKVDTTLPTLIIGWKQTKEMFPQQDILEHKITDTVSWTFSKREKRYKYEEDLSKFIDRVIKSLDDKINYKFFNFIISSRKSKISLSSI
jgi:hypothetical protein